MNLSPFHICSFVLLILYMLLAYGYVCQILSPSPSRHRRLLRILLIVTILAHFSFFIAAGLKYRMIAIGNESMVLSALALGLTTSYFLIEWLTRERNLGAWIIIWPMLFQLLASLGFEDLKATEGVPQVPLLSFHIGSALLGYCAFSLSAVFSIIYLVLYRQLKRRHMGTLFDRLPSLDNLEKMAYRAIHFGVGFLLVSIVLGESLFQALYGRFIWLDPKIVLAAIGCGFYGLIIFLRAPLSLQGRRLAAASLSGYTLILFSLLVLNRLPWGFHDF